MSKQAPYKTKFNVAEINALKRAIQILEGLDSDGYDFLLDHTDARPSDTVHSIQQCIEGFWKHRGTDHANHLA